MSKRRSEQARDSAPVIAHGPAESLAWGALLFALAITPLAMSDFGWLGVRTPLTADIYGEPKVFVLRASALVALAAWGWAVLVHGRLVRRTALDVWVVGFIASLAAVTVFSIHPATSVFGHYRRGDGLLTYVLYAALFFLAVQLVDRASRIRVAAQVLFWSSVVVAFYGVLQYFGLDFAQDVPEYLAARAYSTMGNPLILGGLLVFAVPIAAALALTESRLMMRAVYWAGSALALAALVATFARSAWIGTAVALLVFAAWALWSRLPLMREVDLPAFGGVAAVVGIVAMVSGNSGMNVAGRLGSLLDFKSGSGFSRSGLWDAVWQAALDRPLTGFGLDTTRLFLTRYLEPEYARSAERLAIPDNAHNVLLQLAATVGLAVTALFVALLIVAGWSAARPLIGDRGIAKPTTTRVVLAAWWAACAGYLVHLMSAISMPSTTFLLWLALGILLSPTARRGPAVSLPGARMWAAGLVVLCVGAAVLATVPLRADNRHMRGRGLSDPMARIAAADEAVRLAPYYDTYRTTSAVAHADPVVQMLSTSGGSDSVTPENAAAYEDALARIVAAYDFSPWETDTLALLTVMYNAGGRHVDSRYFADTIRVAEKALVDLPYVPQVRLQYAIALSATGRNEQAIVALEELISVEPRLPEAPVELARSLAAQGDEARARQVLEQADPSVASSPLVVRALEALDSGEEIRPVAW